MKPNKVRILLMVLIMAIFLQGCVQSTETKQYFAVSTGDEIVLEIDKKSGYKIRFDDPYLITKEGQTYFEGGFSDAALDENIRDMVACDEGAGIVDDFEKDGHSYFIFGTDETGTGMHMEFYVIIKIAESNTCATLISTRTEEEVRDALEAITFTLRPSAVKLQ